MQLRSLCVLLSAAAPALPQGVNCTLLGTHDMHGDYANITGYLAPNGKEYALLGARTGTAVVDCSIPTAPVERGFFAGTNSQWRELQVYRQYCYVVTEGSGGFQIIDLSNADAPVLLGTFGTQYFTNCHTITVDPGTGRVYCNGTNAGTVVFDASVTPQSPTYVGIATGPGNSNYWHDFHASNGWGYAAMIYNGQLRIVDLTSPLPFPAVSNTTTPSAFTHNAWPNASHTVVATTDERAGGLVKFYDITNKAAPVALGQYTCNPASIPHNAYIVGNLCHMSWYTEGYRLLDITDPMNPVEVASYDTWPGVSGGFNGAWGVYPFQPSGNIYIMDISTGLYIVRPSLATVSISHTALNNTTSEDGPYVADATVVSSATLTGATLHWSIDGTNFTPQAMTAQGGNVYRGSIPGQFAPLFVSYHITATDSNGTVRSPLSGEYQFLVGDIRRALFDDFETDLGWTHGFTATEDDWQRGLPRGRSGTSGGVGWADPAAAYSGTNVWANDLGVATGSGAYSNNVNNWLQSPVIQTSGIQNLKLRYRRWLGVRSSDFGRVLVNGNLVWTSTGAVQDSAWEWIEHDISAIANAASTLTIRFELQTNGTNVAGGWNLDDLEVYAYSDLLPPVHYGTGTPGTGSITPVVGLVGAPQISQSFSAEGSSLLGGAPSVLGLGFLPANISIMGITGLIDPTAAVFLFAMAGGTANQPGAGTAAWPMSVPNNVLLDNLDLFAQVLALDAGSPGGVFSASDGMRIRVNQY